MRLIFIGTPALAIPSLQALQTDHEIVAVVTQPDKIGGRGHKLISSPVKEFALRNALPVLQPEKARDESFVRELEALKPEAIAVVAYGQILPRAILDLPQQNFAHGGCVNLHFSLLPRWRGAAPVQYAIWRGDVTTGVSTQWMAEKLDAGDLILQREVPILPEETSGDLFERLTPLGAEVLRETMVLMQNGKATRTPQNESDATFAPTIKKDDARIDRHYSAEKISNQIRALDPKPGAWCLFRNDILKIWRARVIADSRNMTNHDAVRGKIVGVAPQVLVACGSGVLELLEVQPAGKPKMSALDWARGARLSVGDKLE